MKTLIRLNLVITAQNSYRIFEDLEKLRFSEADATEVKDVVSKWVRKTLSTEAVESLERKFALFISDKMYPLNQFSAVVERELDDSARKTVQKIYHERENSVEDVPVFILDEEIDEIDYLTLEELGKEEVVSSYILPIYILTEKSLEGDFRQALYRIQHSEALVKFKQSLFIEKIIEAVIRNRFAQSSKLITANMHQTPDETYKEAKIVQNTFRKNVVGVDA